MSRQYNPYQYHNIEAGWRHHICCGEAISIASSECMSVALVIEHANNSSSSSSSISNNNKLNTTQQKY
jgi:hypothetical protein